MIGLPYFFLILNCIAYASGLYFIGFSCVPILMIIFGLIILIYNIKYVGFVKSLAMSIVYLIVFDSNFFDYTSFHIRIWYFLLVVGFLAYFLPLLAKPIATRKIKLSYAIVVLLLFGVTLFHFSFDNLLGKLYAIKYWIFTLGLLGFLYLVFRDCSSKTMQRLVEYFLSIFIFIALIGIYQYFFNLKLGLPNRFSAPLLNINIRPSAFFSETTWYGEYSVFGFIMLLYNAELNESFSYLFAWMIIFLIAIIISGTLNAALAFFLISFILILTNKKKIWLYFLIYLLLLLFLAICLISFNVSFHHFQLSTLLYKLQAKKGSFSGRELAFVKSFNALKKKIWFGHGFNWSATIDRISQSGTSLYAKSFNLFFMIQYIFGLVGTIPLLLGIIMFYKQAFKILKEKATLAWYAIAIFSGFLFMSMFAPLHQYPYGMYIVSLALLILTWCKKYAKT